MNGAEALLRTLRNAEVDTCFANPGTSEMHLVDALDRVPNMRSILCLFEGVATGAADGYARIRGAPAATLLHLGPGLANGLANLHNARRASSPVINIVGDHPPEHAALDTILTSDIEGIARPVSEWVRTTGPDTIAADAAQAVQAAASAPGQVATLIVPANAAWSACSGPAPALPPRSAAVVADSIVERAARLLKTARRPAILLRGDALRATALRAAGRIAAATQARLLCDTFAPRLERGAGIVAVERIPYFAEDMVKFLKDIDGLILVGTKPPTTAFAHAEKPSWCLPEGCETMELARADEDGPQALEALADRLGGAFAPALAEEGPPPFPASDAALTPGTIGACVARLLPEGAIISDDGATSGAAIRAALARARAHIHLSLTGGAIGQGLPVALGAAVAAPDRKVLCLAGDGSGLYTAQALWSMARERLNVTTIVFTNRRYRILDVEFARLGFAQPCDTRQRLFSLSDPHISWAGIAAGFGVNAQATHSMAEFRSLLTEAMRTPGPRLIEAVIE